METLTIALILAIASFVMLYLGYKNKTHRERNKRLKSRNYELQELVDKLTAENGNIIFAYSSCRTKYDELLDSLTEAKCEP